MNRDDFLEISPCRSDEGELIGKHPGDVPSEILSLKFRAQNPLKAIRPRPVLEALIDVSEGRNLDEVLENFGRMSAETYHAVGANYFNDPLLIDCGAST
jgi:hypothetical protein